MSEKYRIMQGEVLDFCRDYDGEPFHALLCDPPYHLTSISTRYKTISERDKQVVNKDPYRRTGRGFMGKQWDGGDIAFQPEIWAAFGTLLHPGAFCAAFAGTRGYHRMACAIEDAGFILHPMMCWLFGSGFPKATRILPKEYEETGETVDGRSKYDGAKRGETRGREFADRGRTQKDKIRVPASEMAKRFSEHRYGLQALKPALEPICVFQKPYKGKPVDCITATGAGALNIGAGRIGTRDDNSRVKSEPVGAVAFGRGRAMGGEGHDAGRWPSNLLIESGDVAAALDAQSGYLQSGKPCGVKQATNQIYGQYGTGIPVTGIGDKGGASRFFMQSDWQVEEYDPFIYAAKAGRAERDAGLEGKPLVASHRHNDAGRDMTNPKNAMGDAERRRIEKGQPGVIPSRNPHPTVKPLRLTRYLASLLLPPAEYAPRRLFVPFAGVASEMCGAHLAGWESVVGVEGQEEYCEIGEARLKFWSMNVNLFDSLTQSDEEETEDAQEAMEI